MPDKGMIHVPGGRKQDSEKFHHANQNGAQFKTYELLISGIFHLIFSDLTETAESETGNEERVTTVLQ